MSAFSPSPERIRPASFWTAGLLNRGRRVALVREAIETLNAEEGRKAIEELTSVGAGLVTTEEALAALGQSATRLA